MQSSGQPSQQPPLQESDIPQLLQLLHGALSPDAAVQKHAESILASIASRTGYCSCLAAIVGNQGADHSARWLAAVQLKNSVNKYWRPRYDTGGLSHQEKAYLRGHFLQLIPQDDNQIAVQVALVIAKAARFDFPQQWPNLFIDLLAGIAVAPAAGGTPAPPSILLLRRTYVVLHHVLKELSSKRLAADQKAFADVAQLLFEHVWSSWGSLLQDILTRLPAELAAPAGSAPPQALLLAFERWLLLLKILRRLLLFGFRSDAKSLQPVPAVALVAPQLLAAMAALHQVQQQQQQSQQQRGQHSSAAVSHRQLSAMVERGMLKLIKTLSQVQQEHPWSFHHAGVLLSLLEACYTQLLAAAGQGPWSPAREALLLTCCQAVLAVLRCDSYAGRLSSNTAGAHTQQASTIKRMAGEVSGQLATWWGAPAQPPQLPALAAALAAAGSGPQQQQPQQQQADGQHTRQSALLVALIAGFFPLTHRDIDEWLDDGEQWALANADTASNLHGLKSCCHQLALSLLLANKASLAPVLVQLLQGVSACVPEGWGRGAAAAWPAIPGPPVPGPSGAANPAVLLLKEAVYEAVGLAAYELHDYIDYPGWLRGSLLPEMMAVGNQQHHQQADGSSSKHKLLLLVLPRAAARLVGHWVADLKATDRPAVYRALTVLLVQPSSADKQQQHKPDVVLQLAAVSAMRIIVDDFGFESEGFVEVLPAVMQALTGMLATSQELDTQTQVFGLMNLIIDRLGPDIKPHVGTVMPLLPQTWLAAADQSLLRIQALCCLSLLVNVLGPDSPALYPVLLPMLRESLHPDSHQPELLEDGLACWLVALRNAPGAAGDPQGPAIALLELTPALVSCLALSTEHIAMGMQLFTSLLLLGGAPFLATYGSQLMSACTAYVGEVVERGLLLMLPPVDLLLVAAPEQAAFVVLPFMQRLLGLLLSGRESAVVAANALALYGRLLLQRPAMFEQLLRNCTAAGMTQAMQPQGASDDAEALLLALTGLWCDAFDSIAQPLARKLAACALATLLKLPIKAMLHYLPVILSHISSVYLELEASSMDDPLHEWSNMMYGAGLWSGGQLAGWEDGGYDEGGLLFGHSLTTSEDAGGEAARREMLREAEPLRRYKVSKLLADMLTAASAVNGQQFEAAMAALDPAIKQQVQAMLVNSQQPQ